MAALGDRQKNYSLIENQCSICKKPSNLLLPVYANHVYEHLTSSTSFAKESKEGIIANLMDQLINHQKDQKSLGWWRDPKCYSKHSLAYLDLENESLSQVQGKLMQFIDYFQRNVRECLNVAVLRENSFEEQISDALCEFLRYSEVIGLVAAVKSFASVYHSIYVTLRLKVINEAERYKLTPEIIENSLPGTLTYLLAAVFESCSDPDQFKLLDLNSIMCRAISLTVGYT